MIRGNNSRLPKLIILTAMHPVMCVSALLSRQFDWAHARDKVVLVSGSFGVAYCVLQIRQPANR